MTQLDDSILMAYVDDELEPAVRQQVAQAIEHDSEAKEKIRLFRLSASLVRAALSDPAYLEVSSGARRALAAPRASALFTRRNAISAMAASLLAVAFTGGYALGLRGGDRGPDFGDRLLDEVADYHVIYARETEHQVEVAAPRADHIEAWLGDRLHRSLHVPDLSGNGYNFAGARLLVVDGQPVAQLLYRAPGRPQKPLGLCISFGAPGIEPARSDFRNGLNEVLWRRNGYSYILVGWESGTFLSNLATELEPLLDRA
jgi:anti-sigma factor RsiW